MPVTPETLRIQAELRDQLDRILDQHTDATLRAWVAAWDEIAPDLADTLEQLITAADGGTVARRVLLRSIRLQGALAHIADTLDDLFRQSAVTAVGNLRRLVDLAGSQQAAVIASQLPSMGMLDWGAWARVDRRALDAIVARSTEQIASASRPLSDQAYRVVRRELVRGVAAGSAPRDTAARMVRRAELGFNGGLARAVNVARTEQLDAYRAGAQAGQQPHADVLAGWVWLTKLQPRTCRACLSMHGRVFGLEVPGPQGHPACRCARSPRVKSWAELGFDGIDEPDDQTPDAGVFFDRLNPEDQRHILGVEGFRAWREGRYPMAAWAVRRENDGWRDSVVASKPPASGRVARPDDRLAPQPGGAGAGGLPPGGAPPAAAGEVPEPDPPIGPVLGTPQQQVYYHAGNLPPRDLQVFVPDANNAFTFVADPDDRAIALLQYDKATEDLVKRAADAIDLGDPQPPGWVAETDGVYQMLAGEPEFGITGANYTADDFRVDILGAATRVLRWMEAAVPLRRHFRGISIPGPPPDLTNPDEVRQVLAQVRATGWLSSWTTVERLATGYADRMPGTSVILMIDDAEGVRLRSMGRMSLAPESLITGLLIPGQYHVKDGRIYVPVRWLPWVR